MSIHHYTTRTKEKESLLKKIESKENKYNDLNDITDICGIRIITYLDSDVDKVATIIENEFNIDKVNSIDKRKLKADQFGYKSLHYVVSLNDARLKLTEYKKFKTYKVEIQVRSILQHAWAEIEHDLGYKGEISIPEHFRRSFSRLAALLETADIEFDRLKQDLYQYEIDVKKDIVTQPNEVEINQASILAFANTNKILNEAKKIIKQNVKFDSSEEKGSFDRVLEILNYMNIKTIGEVSNLLELNKKNYLAFVNKFSQHIEIKRVASFSLSIPLFYFMHYLASKSKDLESVIAYFKFNNFPLEGNTTPQYFIDLQNHLTQS